MSMSSYINHFASLMITLDNNAYLVMHTCCRIGSSLMMTFSGVQANSTTQICASYSWSSPKLKLSSAYWGTTNCTSTTKTVVYIY